MKTIEEKNRIVAEFMGVTPNEFGVYDFGNEQKYSELQYHKSWDWLMPVVEKIEDLGCKFEMFPSETKKKYYIATLMTYANNTFKQNKMFAATGDARIQPVHDVVVQFIEWYNRLTDET